MNILQEIGFLSFIFSGCITVWLGFLAFRDDTKSATRRIFFIQCLAMPIWLAIFMLSARPDLIGNRLLEFMRLSLAFAAPVNLLFVLLMSTFPGSTLVMNRLHFTLWCIGTVVVMGVVLSPLAFMSVVLEEGVPKPNVGPGMLLFILFNIACYGTIFATYLRRLREVGLEGQRALRYLGLGIFLMISFMLFTISLPVAVYNFTLFVPLAPFYTLLFVAATMYASFRYNLFNIKVIATQVFVTILTVVFFARIFGTVTLGERLVNTLIFVATIGFGFLLVRSVRQEIKAREEIRALADELAATNVQLEVSNERLRIFDQRKSEFVSIASHQLRTPVTAIKGYTSLLLEDAYGPLSEKIKDPIQKIFHSSERLVLMINDFLNVSKIEQNSMTYTFVPLDLKKMVIELVEDFHIVAGEKKIDLATDIPDGENFYVVADEGKIRQIISNLIDNSIKYTPKGSVRLILEKEPDKGEFGMIHLMIKDTGIGLSQDDIHHLFGKFTRGAEGSKVNTSGSGLGLYVAKQMMEKHQGNIWVDSEGKGKGSVFSIELPEFHGELPAAT